MRKSYQSIRIFKSDFMESLTHVHPIIPLLIWGPVSVYFLYKGAQDLNSASLVILWFFVGLIVWTLSEYLLHRFVFHFPAKSKMAKRFVFLFHGLHHDDPNDPTRLVMPPVPALLFLILLYGLFSLMVPTRALNSFFGSFIIGYLIYDYIHFATHHFKMSGKVGRYLKKYHLQHHHRHEPSKYGVSSPLWDIILGTVGKK